MLDFVHQYFGSSRFDISSFSVKRFELVARRVVLGCAYAGYRLRFLKAVLDSVSLDWSTHDQVDAMKILIRYLLTKPAQAAVRRFASDPSSSPTVLLDKLRFPVGEDAAFVRMVVLRRVCVQWSRQPSSEDVCVGWGSRSKLSSVVVAPGTPMEKLEIMHSTLLEDIPRRLLSGSIDGLQWKLDTTQGIFCDIRRQHTSAKSRRGDPEKRKANRKRWLTVARRLWKGRPR